MPTIVPINKEHKKHKIMRFDTISGALRLVDSLFLTGGLALGFWMSFGFFGG